MPKTSGSGRGIDCAPAPLPPGLSPATRRVSCVVTSPLCACALDSSPALSEYAGRRGVDSGVVSVFDFGGRAVIWSKRSRRVRAAPGKQPRQVLAVQLSAVRAQPQRSTISVCLPGPTLP